MPSENEEQKEVCIELDQTLREFFSVLTALYQEQSLLEDKMKSGFLNMSRARYSMGIKNVGIQQCDETRMRAEVKVHLEDGKFERVTCMDNQETAGVISPGKSTDSTVRRRNITTKSEDGFEVIEKIEEIKLDSSEDQRNVQDTTDSKVCDPLRWFGVLVAPALRQSQKDFKDTADIIVSIANLKSQLLTMKDKYKSLLQKKSKLGS